jgi:hypothetical protein
VEHPLVQIIGQLAEQNQRLILSTNLKLLKKKAMKLSFGLKNWRKAIWLKQPE